MPGSNRNHWNPPPDEIIWLCQPSGGLGTESAMTLVGSSGLHCDAVRPIAATSGKWSDRSVVTSTSGVLNDALNWVRARDICCTQRSLNREGR